MTYVSPHLDTGVTPFGRPCHLIATALSPQRGDVYVTAWGDIRVTSLGRSRSSPVLGRNIHRSAGAFRISVHAIKSPGRFKAVDCRADPVQFAALDRI